MPPLPRRHDRPGRPAFPIPRASSPGQFPGPAARYPAAPPLSPATIPRSPKPVPAHPPGLHRTSRGDNDEPANHLGLPAIEPLEAALASYPGTLLLVTHDRRMLEAVTANRRIGVADGTVTSR